MTVLLHLYDSVIFLCIFDESLMNNLLHNLKTGIFNVFNTLSQEQYLGVKRTKDTICSNWKG